MSFIILPLNAPLALLAFKNWLLEMKLTQYDREKGMAGFLGKYNDPYRRPSRKSTGRLEPAGAAVHKSQLAGSSGGPRKVLWGQ